MNIFSIFSLFGGLALFIFGMNIMSEALQKSTGSKLKTILGKLTNNQISALFIGLIIAVFIQSSATTVMLVGFINAGLINLFQSIGVMLGANIGTTISMQLISFNLTKYASLFIAVGILTLMLVKNDKWKHLANLILGFGLLFLGMSIMKESVAPLKDSVQFKNLLAYTDGSSISGMFLGVLTATAITGVIQSSGATIGILFSFSAAGIFTSFSQVFPLVLGAQIGTCATPLLGSIGTGINAKRSAFSHLIFNIIGAVIAVFLFDFYNWLIPLIDQNLTRQIANFHTIVQILNSLIFLIIAKYYVYFIKFIIRGKENDKENSYIDPLFLKTPEMALVATIKELRRSLLITRKMFKHSIKGFIHIDEHEFIAVRNFEKAIDQIKASITNYIAKIAQYNLSSRQAVLVQQAYVIIKNIERIGDHINNICKITHDKASRGVWFDEIYMEKLIELYIISDKFLILTSNTLSINMGKDFSELISLKEDYFSKSKDFRDFYREQIEKHKEQADNALIFIRYINVFDKVVKHTKNILDARMDPLFYLKEEKFDKIDVSIPKASINEKAKFKFNDDLLNKNDYLLEPKVK